jgi:hypothetical protein
MRPPPAPATRRHQSRPESGHQVFETYELTFAGMTVLRFNDHGKVIDHRDYDNHVERRREAPYAGW